MHQSGRANRKDDGMDAGPDASRQKVHFQGRGWRWSNGGHCPDIRCGICCCSGRTDDQNPGRICARR